MRRKEMKQLLEERLERIALLETRIDTMEQLVDGYRAREQSIIDTLHSAQESAAHLCADAEQKAAQIIQDAQRQANELLLQAQAEAEAAIAEAGAESERLRRQTEDAVHEYEELLATFNAVIEHNAEEARAYSEQYQAFIRSRRVDTPALSVKEAEAGPAVPSSGETPDAGDNPARVMQTIYRMQQRDIPEEAAQHFEQTAGEQAADGAGEQAAYEQAEAILDELLREQETGIAAEQRDAPPDAEATSDEPRQTDASPEAEQEPVRNDAQADVAQEADHEPTDCADAAEQGESACDARTDTLVDDVAEEIEVSESYDPLDDGTPRDWEPDMDEIPTVGKLMPDSGADDDGASLDELLDEIIRSGE